VGNLPIVGGLLNGGLLGNLPILGGLLSSVNAEEVTGNLAGRF
jgi:hypothetical protein